MAVAFATKLRYNLKNEIILYDHSGLYPTAIRLLF